MIKSLNLPSAAAMLSIRHLSVVGLGKKSGLSDISLEVTKGELVAIVGPNGAGKSLLLRTIADPDIRFDGDIIVNHFHNRTEPTKAKIQIGYSSPSLGIEKHLTGFEYLELIGSFYQLSGRARVDRITTLAQKFHCLDGLYTLLERQSPALHQKVWLMSSLLHQPPLL